MTQPRQDPAASLRELPAGSVEVEPGDPDPLAEFTRALLHVRGVAEMEDEIVRALHRATGSRWVALLREQEGVYRCTRAYPASALALEPLPAAIVDAAVPHGGQPRSWTEDPQLARFVPAESGMIARLALDLTSHPPLLIFAARPLPHSGGERAVDLAALLECAGIALGNAEVFDRLRSQVFIDFVTDCYNRRAFEEHLTVEFVRATRYSRPLGLLLIDLDDFKHINDEFGHPAGDHALRQLGDVLRGAFRTTDRVCRYGGDEFAVLFPETPKEEVLRLAERLRRQITRLFPDERIPLGLTASFGVAGYPVDGGSPEALVQAADRALYAAKSQGRDRVESV